MRLLVAYEGSAGARAALREAGRLAQVTRSEVVLLRVVNPLTDAADILAPTTAEAMVRVVAAERAALEAAARDAGLPDATVIVEEQRHGEDVAEVIERVAAERSADLIVISSRRTTSMGALVLGSVTHHVLSHARCPVVLVPR